MTPHPPETRSWAHPECPVCDSEVFVDKRRDGERYQCQQCGEVFSDD